MKSLFRSYDMTVQSAYVIHLPNNAISHTLSERCVASCKSVGMPVELHEGFDGTSGNIVVPSHLENSGWYKWLKLTDNQLSITEVACALSHISLWVKCMELDQPIVVLEHDAIVVAPYLEHQAYNAISYLGSKEQLEQNTGGLIPPFSAINKNWYFINRAHAYAIDPPVAKRLFSIVLDRGIFESLDIMIKSDDVAIVQTGFYAYDAPEQTTIINRK